MSRGPATQRQPTLTFRVVYSARVQGFVFATTGTARSRAGSKYKAWLDGKMLEAQRQQARAEGRDPKRIEFKRGSTVTCAARRAR